MLVSELNRDKVDVTEGLDLLGLGRHEINVRVPKRAYFDLLREEQTGGMYNYDWKGGNTLNLLKATDVDYNTIPEADYATYWGANVQPQRGSNDSSGWFRCNHNSTSSYTNRMKQEFSVTAGKEYTLRFLIRGNLNGAKPVFTTYFYENTVVDTTKPFIVNMERKKTVPSDGAVDWHNEVYLNEDQVDWTECFVTFTAKSTTTTNVLFRARRATQGVTDIEISQPMIYEGNQLTYQPSYLPHKDYLRQYVSKATWLGRSQAYANIGFYYSSEYDFACLYKVNVKAGVKVNGFNVTDNTFDLTLQVETFSFVTDVKVYEGTRPSNITTDTAIGYISYNDSRAKKCRLEARMKGCYVQMFDTEMLGLKYVATFKKTPFNPSNLTWYYGNLQFIDVEN